MTPLDPRCILGDGPMTGLQTVLLGATVVDDVGLQRENNSRQTEALLPGTLSAEDMGPYTSRARYMVHTE